VRHNECMTSSYSSEKIVTSNVILHYQDISTEAEKDLTTHSLVDQRLKSHTSEISSWHQQLLRPQQSESSKSAQLLVHLICTPSAFNRYQNTSRISYRISETAHHGDCSWQLQISGDLHGGHLQLFSMDERNEEEMTTWFAVGCQKCN